MSAHAPLLVVIDPVARTLDGESVRIAKDVLRAGADSLKFCLPDSVAEWERMLRHRGRRRPVVVGDDAALLRTVRTLRSEGTLGQLTLSYVPVGPRRPQGLAERFGVPLSAAPAARAALEGAERALDLLVDDSGGIVVGALRIPGVDGRPEPAPEPADARPPESGDGAARRHWLERGARSLARALSGPHGHPMEHLLRVEADGVLLADLDRPVHQVCVDAPDGGLALVRVHQAGDRTTLSAHEFSVSGRDFRYRADEAVCGPVRHRTWTVHPSAWRLTVPAKD
ncbi:diacylglycerol kinase [Streptomyces sp. SL13]|uniref:Diacylglycerol kinase n=1 Tax=Streptantibioticus silvisoli TaxID=2705255 RepID=A0AA90H5M3_9ACTN|nr:diacylglycerol kinase [Streptantibioticus silvisoli]MDI5962072.1 diacylglycerol kinase [Streptantibioticus silvisoli]MDI5971290.1 diacylglycerol kinase [Streptantibioticus silvisoli]